MTERYGNATPILVSGNGLPEAKDVDVATGDTDMTQIKRQYVNEAMKGKFECTIMFT